MKIKNTRTDEKHFRGDIGHLELIFSLTDAQYYEMMSIQYFIRVQLILRRLVSRALASCDTPTLLICLAFSYL